MKKTWFLLFALVLVSAMVLSACGGGGNAGNTGGEGQATTELDRPEPPAEYASKTNPNTGTAGVEEGKAIYATNCASCHGVSGLGDGPAAAALDPKPQDLKDNEESLSDGYLHWRIAEGGQMEPFNSAMPAWKNVLNEEQIWQVISYIRSLD